MDYSLAQVPHLLLPILSCPLVYPILKFTYMKFPLHTPKNPALSWGWNCLLLFFVLLRMSIHNKHSTMIFLKRIKQVEAFTDLIVLLSKTVHGSRCLYIMVLMKIIATTINWAPFPDAQCRAVPLPSFFISLLTTIQRGVSGGRQEDRPLIRKVFSHHVGNNDHWTHNQSNHILWSC